MRRSALQVLLALGHGLNDCLAGYMLGRLSGYEQDITKLALGIFLYNLLAFGGQYPVSLWIEKTGKHAFFIRGAMVSNGLALLLFSLIPGLGILFAGIASAVYHVAGGAVCSSSGKAAPVGLFAAPGVAGLVLGGYAAYSGWDIQFYLTGAVILHLLLQLAFHKKEFQVITDATVQPAHKGPDRHDWIMIILLLMISVRSVIWNVFQILHDKEYHWLIWIALAAAAGKLAGGWIADRIGWRFYLYSSQLIALPLLTLFKKEMILFCVGVGLLQSGIPASTALLIRASGGKKERAIGLSFGLAVAAGAILFYTPLQSVLKSDSTIWLGTLLILLSVWWSGRIKNNLSH